MFRLSSLAAAWAVLLFATASFAQGPEGQPSAEEAQRETALRQLADGLNYQTGHITLKDGLAAVNVPSGFRYLAPKDAETVLTKIWGNQPGGAGLGMLLPAEVSPVEDSSWAVIISYSEDGYVKDDEASKINYNDLLKDMQKGTLEANKERVEQGYPAIELIGWAKPPRYDQDSHKLYWAKELKVAEASVHTLNYNIRMLGRRGVLVLNAIAGMNQLPEIEQAIPSVLGMVDFQDGHRYTDFNPSTDKVATYGLAALVTGGILAKAGFFKMLIPALLAAKKFVIIGLVALGSLLKKVFGGKRTA